MRLASLAFVSWAAAHELEVPFDPPGDSCAVRSAVDDCNLIHLAAMDNNRGLLHKRQINCTHWTSWLELGGQFAGGPALVKNSRGQIELYVRGVDKHMYRRVYSHTCAGGSPESNAGAGERLRSVGEQPELGSSNGPSTHSQLLEGAVRSGKQRVYVQMIEQPPSSTAAAPSIGRAVTLSIDSADSMAALSKQVAEALGTASGSEVGLPRIYLNNAELTDAEHLERSAAQNSIPPEGAPARPQPAAPCPALPLPHPRRCRQSAPPPPPPPHLPAPSPLTRRRHSACAAHHGERGRGATPPRPRRVGEVHAGGDGRAAGGAAQQQAALRRGGPNGQRLGAAAVAVPGRLLHVEPRRHCRHDGPRPPLRPRV